MTSAKGCLFELEIEIQKILKKIEQPEARFETLIAFLKTISSFQDKNLEEFTKIKNKLKTTDPDLFSLFGPLHETIKICGRDQFKQAKHKTGFVVNKAGVKVSRMGMKKTHEKITPQNIFLHTDYYNIPQPLGYINQIKPKKASIIDQQMVQELDKKAENFVKENGEKILNLISQLRTV